MNIKIGFSYPKKFKIGAWLISKWLNRPYSHTYIFWEDSQGREIVYQAAHGTVHMILLDNFLMENNIIEEYTLPISNESYQHLRDYCYLNSGFRYSYIDLAYIVIYDILSKLGIKFLPVNPDGYICSELVSVALALVFGFKLPKPSYLMTPSDVEKLLEDKC